jgi:hypothetical protein
MATRVQEKEMATTAHMKTIDGDYCDGYYGCKGGKWVAVFQQKAERTRRACIDAKDHGRAGAAR